MSALTLQQRLVLERFLTDALKKLRVGTLLPQAEAQLEPGERFAVKFGDRRAAWVTMPQAAGKMPYVSDESAFLAWAEVHYPDRVATVTEVVTDDDVIAVLEQHCPHALKRTKRVDEYFRDDLLKAFKGGGSFITSAGENLTSAPGIVTPDPGQPVPRVVLDEDAAAIIRAAWRAGDISADDLLALPAPEESAQ